MEISASGDGGQRAADAFIFGDQLLHVRFFTAIELLAQIMKAAPGAMTSAKLAENIGQPQRWVRTLLRSLVEYGLIAQDEKSRDAWRCPGRLSAVTLADIFRCMSAVATESDVLRKAICGTALAPPSGSTTRQSVDLLLMQATMTVNQVVLQQLQQFDLGRLMAVASARQFAGLRLRPRSYSSEPC